MKRRRLRVLALVLASIVVLSVSDAYFIGKHRTTDVAQIAVNGLSGTWKSGECPVVSVQKRRPLDHLSYQVPEKPERVAVPDPEADGIHTWYTKTEDPSAPEMISYTLTIKSVRKAGKSPEYVLEPWLRQNGKWLRGRCTRGALGRAVVSGAGYTFDIKIHERGSATLEKLTRLSEFLEATVVNDALGSFRYNTVVLHRDHTARNCMLVGILACLALAYYVWSEHRRGHHRTTRVDSSIG